MLQSCPTFCDPVDCIPPGSSVHRFSPSKNNGVGCHALLQGIFLTKGLNTHLSCLLKKLVWIVKDITLILFWKKWIPKKIKGNNRFWSMLLGMMYFLPSKPRKIFFRGKINRKWEQFGYKEGGTFCDLINVSSPKLIHEVYHFDNRSGVYCMFSGEDWEF